MRYFRLLPAIWLLCASTLATLMTFTASAEEKVVYDRVSLTGIARGELKNNLMRVVFYAQAEHKKASEAARQVNSTLQKVQQDLDGETEIERKTLAYATSPVYDDGVVVAWRVRQSLLLESENLAHLADVMGKLQADLAVESVRFDATDAARQEKEDELIRQALAVFEERAQLIQNQLGAKGYRLVTVDVNTESHGVRPYEMARSAVMSMDSAPAPALDAGDQDVTVRVNGYIELQR